MILVKLLHCIIGLWQIALFSSTYETALHKPETIYNHQNENYLLNHTLHNMEHWENEHFPISRNTSPAVPLQKKPWTFIVYMAADNDLRGFAGRNIQQMAQVGSNDNINILVHLDIRLSATEKITRHYFIKDSTAIYEMNKQDPYTQSMDSGDPKTLITTCMWAARDFPADQYALILWNHGTGTLDPSRHRISNPLNLYHFNNDTHMLELDRSISFIDYVERGLRGVCWDDTTGNYLTNQKLNTALAYICNNVIGKKFSIIGFDACLMAMVEIGNILTPYADMMIASQEVEMGAGWNYQSALASFLYRSPSVGEVSNNIVRSYQNAYETITRDYTLSSIDLSKMSKIEGNVHMVAELLCNCFDLQEKNNITLLVKQAGSSQVCTNFEEPTYIDLFDFYTNLLGALKKFKFKVNNQDTSSLLNSLEMIIKTGQTIILNTVTANTTGANLRKARGLSIYFPQKSIHPSYYATQFAQKNSWLKLIRRCISVK